MRKLGTLIFAAFAAFLVAAGPAQAEKRVALVIGNGGYQNATKLPNPSNDANAIAALFKSAGFDVVDARQDLGNLDFKRAVRDFTAAARDADIAVVYYAGHGMEIGGTNYLLPIDAKLVSDFDAEDEALSLDRLVRAIEPARRLRLVILDACRDNPFVRTMQRTISTRAVSTGLAKVEPTSGDTLIAFAAKAGSTADDGRGANSPFTAALVKHIGEPGLDVRIAFGRVRDEVLKTTANKQEPFVYGSLGGSTVSLVPERKIVVEPKTEPAPVPTAAVVAAEEIRRDYEFAERVGTKEAWDSFLARHKTGFYADLARAQRVKAEPKPQVKAEPQVALLPAPPQVAPATPPPPPPVAPVVDPTALTRALQVELKRVGCDPGELGPWTGRSRQALTLFNKTAGTGFDVKVASIDALDGVKGKTARVCPLVCGRNQRPDGETCVAVAPPVVEERPAIKRPPAVERLREKRAVSARPARGGSCPPGYTTITQGGRQCCEHTPPDRGRSVVMCP